MTNNDFMNNSSPEIDPSNLSEAGRAYFRSVFDKFDKDGNGIIDEEELATELREDHVVSDFTAVRELIESSDKNDDGKIDVDEFINMALDKRFKQIFGRYVKIYIDFIVPPDKKSKFKPVSRRAGDVEGSSSDVDGAYEQGFSCCPPPICMILVSIFEVICFFLNQHITDDSNNDNDPVGPVGQILVYNPEKRHECWRFLTYMLVHIGWMHLVMNLITQVFLGVALELRNRWWRVLTVYTAGVIAGSLVTSIMDPKVYLAGASGGVYAILTAHISNIVINWKDMTFPSVQLFIYLLLISADVFTAIHNRYTLGDKTPIGYAAHFGGALAGFLVGIWVLKNVEVTDKEKYLWWAAFVGYLVLMIIAILLNIFWKDHFLLDR